MGREGSPLDQFAWWLGHIFATVDVPVSGSIDEASVNAIFDTWDAEVIARPANQGGIQLVEGTLEPVYPQIGSGVDRPAGTAIVESSLLAPRRRT